MLLNVGLRCLVLILIACRAVAADTARAPLQVEVFNGTTDPAGFLVNSALISGQRDMVLIDAQFSQVNAHRLAARIIESGKNLTTIYITHAHPDHYFGLATLKTAFPEARVVAVPAVAAVIAKEFDFKVRYWRRELGHNGPLASVNVDVLEKPLLMLEGERLEIIGPFDSDMPDTTAVWIPSIRTLVAGDAIVADIHVWLAHAKTRADRDAWLAALDRLEALRPVRIVPGHAPDATRTSPNAIGFTREYIRIFEHEFALAKDGATLNAAMRKRYPDLAGEISIDFTSRILKDGWVWEAENITE